MSKRSEFSAVVPVALAERSYQILIGTDQLRNPINFEGLPSARYAAIVTNPTVGALYVARLQSALGSHYEQQLVIELPDGEASKEWGSLNAIFDALLSAGCDRKTTIFALGGGVIGDITGFAAACYMRGVPFVQVPTTLLAQVDSSVGGKTAINHRLGKNMIGAFYQPIRVVADLATLNTLPTREVVAGLAEVIKYGPIADLAFFEWVDSHIDALVARDTGALAYAVQRSCEIKAQVVAQDEHEAGVRAHLNFGHTFGHAIELGLGYGQWLHGEAVGCGMVMAADLSMRLGLIDEAYAKRLTRLIQRAGLPTKGPALGSKRYLELMQVDKKAHEGKIRFVLIESTGRAVVRPVPGELVVQVIESLTTGKA